MIIAGDLTAVATSDTLWAFTSRLQVETGCDCNLSRHYPSNLWFSANCSSVSAAMEEIAFRSHLTVLI